MKTGVEKTFHSNGQIAGEVTYVNGLPNGVTRRWHPNGVLAAEYSVKDGNYEGISKQWNEKGELLGSFEIRDGTGTIKTWYPNGQLMGETSMLNGKWTGLHRGWFEDGIPVGDHYYIENQKVSKKKYLAACKENPSFPHYDDQGLKVTTAVKPKGAESLNRESAKENSLARQLLAEPGSREVLHWLQEGSVTRTLGELATREDSIELAKEVYNLGATKVTAVKIDRYPDGGENTGKLVVYLPKEKALRKRLFAWATERAEEQGYDPERDTGQKHLFVMLD